MAEAVKRRLIVEGKDDQMAITALLRRHGFDCGSHPKFDPVIQPAEGVDELLRLSETSVKTYDRLGFVLDSDENVEARWAQMRDRLRRAAVAVPDRPLSEGFVGGGARPNSRVGVWLMPDNVNRGMLETFLGTLVPQGDKAWAYVPQAVGHAKGLGASFKNEDKARIYTWLAWQDPEGRPFGTAITDGALGAESDVADRFVAWFHRLFTAP